MKHFFDTHFNSFRTQSNVSSTKLQQISWVSSVKKSQTHLDGIDGKVFDFGIPFSRPLLLETGSTQTRTNSRERKLALHSSQPPVDSTSCLKSKIWYFRSSEKMHLHNKFSSRRLLVWTRVPLCSTDERTMIDRKWGKTCKSPLQSTRNALYRTLGFSCLWTTLSGSRKSGVSSQKCSCMCVSGCVLTLWLVLLAVSTAGVLAGKLSVALSGRKSESWTRESYREKSVFRRLFGNISGWGLARCSCLVADGWNKNMNEYHGSARYFVIFWGKLTNITSVFIP